LPYWKAVATPGSFFPTGVGIGGCLVPRSRPFYMMFSTGSVSEYGLLVAALDRRSETNSTWFPFRLRGLIAGEAIIAVIIPLLVVMGIVQLEAFPVSIWTERHCL
jgi:hypothetical protein